MKKFLVVTIALALCAYSTIACAASKADNGLPDDCRFKNVIVLVPDGCNSSIQTATRWYKGSPLNLDGLSVGSMSHSMANSVITGSAASATAFATGYKTTARFIGLGHRIDDLLLGVNQPLGEPLAPLATVLEAAKIRGKATGLISTSRITHATPASYAAHILDRGWDNEIMEHMVYNDVDVVFGGGSRHLLPESAGGRRTDGENLMAVLSNRGYQYVDTREDMLALTSGKTWGLFASSHMAADLDNAYFGYGQPTIAEMTEKAIDLLSQYPAGFFLMVEGSQIDWAGHANDPIYMITDFLAFDEAVGKAIDFAEEDGDTLVLVFPDHDTGAFAIGNRQTNSGSLYTSVSVQDIVGPLSGMQMTAWGLSGLINDGMNATELKTAIQTYWGIAATDEDAAQIIAYQNDGISLDYSIARTISENHTYFGWTSHGHNAGDVPVWAYVPTDDCECLPVGSFDNTDMAEICADAFGINLPMMNRMLYVDVRDAFSSYEIDKTDPENPVLKVEGASLPTSKDILTMNGQNYYLSSVVVHSPTAEWCVYDNGSVSSAKTTCTDSSAVSTYVKNWESVFLPLEAVWCIKYGLCP